MQMQNTSASETTFKWVVWGMVSGWRPKDGKTGFLFLNFFFLKKKKKDGETIKDSTNYKVVSMM